MHRPDLRVEWRRDVNVFEAKATYLSSCLSFASSWLGAAPVQSSRVLQYTPGSHSSAELQCQWLVQCSEQISTSGNSAGLVATKKSNSVACVTQPELLETLASSLGFSCWLLLSFLLPSLEDRRTFRGLILREMIWTKLWKCLCLAYRKS